MKKSIVAIVLVAGAILGAVFLFPFILNGGEGPQDEQLSQEDEPVVYEPQTVSIVCAGDIMVHASQLDAQKTGDGDYDFHNNFEYIKDYIQGADIAICNIETTFGGSPYTGYPSFSTPDVLAEALRDTGFDVAVTSNNHMLDRGVSGLLRTNEVLEQYGFVTTGSVSEENDPRYAMYTLPNGVDIAVIGYTYETPTGNRRSAINGSVLSEETAMHINSFSYEYLTEDLEKVNNVVNQAREAGAEIVVLFYHWGEEYQLESNPWQRRMAEETIALMDVDVIFGSHPHVLQETAFLPKDESGRKIPVYYSLGNLISNQRRETLDNKYTEQGAIARVDISIIPETGEICGVEMAVTPTWVEKYTENGRVKYYVIPLDENMESNAALAASGHLSRATDAKEIADGLLGIDRCL